MAAKPGNSLNQNSTTAGLQNWDGTATASTTALAQYNTMVGASTTTVQNIVPGTSGWVLTSAGASAYPAYAAPVFTKMPWTDKSGNFAAASQNGYFVTATCAGTMPASPAQGDVISFSVDSASGILTVTGNTGQTLQIGTAISAAAGTAASNFTGDSVTFVYRSSDTNWIAESVIGTWTVT